MFFKSGKRILLHAFCGAVLLLSTGCSLPIGENPPPAIPPETGFAEQTKCLNILVRNFESYFKGSARDPEVRATWNCIGNVVSLFEKSIRGRYEDRFTSRELANFVEQNFLKNQTVSDSTMTEVFRVKQLLVGGEISSISREEMGRLVLLIHQIGDIALKLNPYMKVYTFNWKIEGSSPIEAELKYFQNANLQLQIAAKDLAILIEKNGQVYKIDYFMSLIKEISQYASTPWTWLEDLEKTTPLVRQLKQIVTDGDESNILPKEWHRFALLAGRVYIQYLRYSYFLQNREILQGSGLRDLISFVKDSESVLQEIIVQKPANPVSQISFAEFRRLWIALKTAGILPEKLSLESLERVTKVLAQKFLIDPRVRLDPGNRRKSSRELPTGLNMAGLEQLDSEFTIWSENQKVLDQIYQTIPLNAGKLGSDILNDLNQERATVGLNELKLVYDTGIALSFDQQGRMQLKQPAAPYLQKTSNLINLVRSLVRLVIRSYAMDERRTDSLEGGLTLAEANTFFLDLQLPLVDLGILDPLNSKFMINRFREANLFTGVSNGDEYLDFREGNNLGLMILSGLKIDSMLYEKLEKVCQVTKPSEFKYHWTFNVACVHDLYKQEIPEKYSSMPDFVKFLSTLSAERFQELFLNLLKATGYVAVPEGTIKICDLALFPQATQYVEVAFQKYDRDRDGYFNTTEAMGAYPTFRRILREAAQGKLESDEELRALLAWLLRYGKPPTNIFDFGKFKLWWMPKGEQGWNVQADREKFIKILGFMADAVSKLTAAELVEDKTRDIEELKAMFCDWSSPHYNSHHCTQFQ